MSSVRFPKERSGKRKSRFTDEQISGFLKQVEEALNRGLVQRAFNARVKTHWRAPPDDAANCAAFEVEAVDVGRDQIASDLSNPEAITLSW